jgi:hypothetical protein
MRTLIRAHSKSRWKSAPGTLPTGVAVIEGADSASIAGAVATVNLPVKPKCYVYHVVLDLLLG